MIKCECGKNSFYVTWKEYDKYGNCIYYKDARGIENWLEYDTNNNMTH